MPFDITLKLNYFSSQGNALVLLIMVYLINENIFTKTFGYIEGEFIVLVGVVSLKAVTAVVHVLYWYTNVHFLKVIVIFWLLFKNLKEWNIL